MGSIAVSCVAFVCISCGAFLGSALRKLLPGHHLGPDAKDVVRLGTGLVGTIAALVLGLLIASAKNSFDTQRTQIRQLTANIILLDELLAQYGPETFTARDLLRSTVDILVDRIWRENSSGATNVGPFKASTTGEEFYAKLLQLSPQNDAQRSLKARAIQVSTDLVQTRLLLFAQIDNSLPTPFLVVLIFWITIIFASFSLFAEQNPIVIGSLLIFALSATGAIFLVLEMGQAFSGLMQISNAPLRSALAPLHS
jgi:Protein of unknown function (DUF4239)